MELARGVAADRSAVATQAQRDDQLLLRQQRLHRQCVVAVCHCESLDGFEVSGHVLRQPRRSLRRRSRGAARHVQPPRLCRQPINHRHDEACWLLLACHLPGNEIDVDPVDPGALCRRVRKKSVNCGSRVEQSANSRLGALRRERLRSVRPTGDALHFSTLHHSTGLSA